MLIHNIYITNFLFIDNNKIIWICFMKSYCYECDGDDDDGGDDDDDGSRVLDSLFY